MKRIFPVLLLALIGGGFSSCSHTSHTTSPAPDLQLLTKIQAANKSIQGGDGQSTDTAIILTDKTSAAISQEYAVYREIYGTEPAGQALMEKNGRHYDVLFDDKRRELYFDITAYWKHTYGGR